MERDLRQLAQPQERDSNDQNRKSVPRFIRDGRELYIDGGAMTAPNQTAF
jgi:hypothetical protein